MADEVKTKVRQDSYSIETEGSQGYVRLNPRGELVAIDQYQQWVLDGRVYLLSNIARETAAAMGTASATFADTDPAILIDVPSGTTMIPLEILLNQGGTVGGGVVTVLITLEDAIRYSSGGIAIPKQNMRFDEPRSSNCAAYEGTTNIVSAAATDDITLYGTILDQDVATIPGSVGTRVHWSARQYIAPVLIGPASLVIYTYCATPQPSWFFSIKYGEWDTAEIT